MKLAIITTTFKPELSGIAETVHKRIREFSKYSDLEVLLIAPDYLQIKDFLPNYEDFLGQIFENVRVITYPSRSPNIKVNKKDGRIIVPFWKYSIDKELENYKPDIIHVEEPERLFGPRIFDGYMRRVGINYSRKNKVPIVAMWHTDYYKYAKHYISFKPALPVARMVFRKILKWVYNSYDMTICNSKEAKSILEKFGVKNLKYMNSVGIDLEHFVKKDVCKNKKDINLIFVGRITPEKSINILFEAYEILHKKHENLLLHIIGDGPLLNEYQSKYKEFNNIKFYGKILNQDLPEYLSIGDIFINPSYTETFTQSAAEATACSLPIIAAAGGGNFEMVEEGKNGFLFEPNNAKALCDKIEYLISNPEKIVSFGNYSRYISKKFCMKEAGINFYKTYIEMIEKMKG